MTRRERLLKTLRWEVVDRVPVALFPYYISINEMLGADTHVPRRSTALCRRWFFSLS